MRKNFIFIFMFFCVSVASACDYHVAKTGKDSNKGTKYAAFLTIQHAAAIAQPGDTVTVHEGVYRERVSPLRGGISDDKRIVYQAAMGEKVVIKGSEVVKGWTRVTGDTWKVVLPNTFFGDFNPYSDVIGGEWYNTPKDGFDRHTGTVYLNGNWLDEAYSLNQILPSLYTADLKDKVLGGKVAVYSGKEIESTKEDFLYQSCRFDLGGYRLLVPDGTYRVTLKFCEPHFDSSNKRVFDVKIQGKTVLSKFDIFAKVGKFTKHDEIFEGIQVSEGQLKIDIIDRVSLACISGIAIENSNYSKKINCGGGAWKGYQPDLTSTKSEIAVTHNRPLWKANVDEKNTTIWAEFKNVDPNKELVEINVRQSVFYPEKPGCNYITVRGFTMRHAATPWSGAMSEQIGLVGTHWSKGWLIEDNVISHSMNTGITLGRYDLGKYGISLPAVTAPGFVQSCEYAIKHGWSKQNIGSHVVRNNHISHCEKNGIHGSLGGIFSIIEGNTICDISQRRWIAGPDVAGLKLLASNDVIIRCNHIYRCGGFGGVWLDWMAQGTRVTGNLLHDNNRDLFMEVDHGPFLIDNNIFISKTGITDWSQGGAYVHNLISGSISWRTELRQTPYFQPHSTKEMKLSNIQHKDLRFYNNMFVGSRGLSTLGENAVNTLDGGNVYLAGAKPSANDKNALVAEGFNHELKLEQRLDGWWLHMVFDQGLTDAGKRDLVTTELLGKAKIPDAPFEQPDGSPYKLDKDYFGNKRGANPAAGPFELSGDKSVRVKVWPAKSDISPASE